MANTYSTRILHDGERLASVVINGTLDTSDQAEIVAVDCSSLGGTPGRVGIRRILHSIGDGLVVRLNWENSRIGAIYGHGDINCNSFGGINNENDGIDGNIYLETDGYSAGTVSYSVTIEVVKQDAVSVVTEAIAHYPLTTSIPSAATFTRASVAWSKDHEGIWRYTPTGASRHFGARLVHNCQPQSEPVSGWSGGGTSAPTVAYTTLDGTNAVAVTFPTGGSGYGFSNADGGTGPFGPAVNGVTKFAVRCVVQLSRALTGGEGVVIYVVGGVGTDCQITFNSGQSPTSPTLVGAIGTATGSGSSPNQGIYTWLSSALSSPVTLTITKIQVTNITGASVQAPPEYVSRGVLSAPYHGAAVDGVRYFPTQNGNSLAGSVLTEATGAPIAAATLQGYRAENARTQYLGVTDAPATQTTMSLGAGTYCLWMEGTGSATSSAGTATGSGWGAATDGSPNVITITGAGTVTVTVAGSPTRFQLENGAFPTSYIYNGAAAGTSVTRNADVLRVAQAGISSAASMLATVNMEHLGIASFLPGIVELSDGTSMNESHSFVSSATSTPGVYVNDAGVPYQVDAGATISENVPAKVAIRVNASGAAISVDGAAVATVAGDIPVGLNTLSIGCGYNTATTDGSVRDVYVWNRGLTNAEMESVAT